MTYALTIIGSVIAFFLGRHYFNAWRRGRSIRRFFAEHPAAKEAYDRLNKHDLTDKRMQVISTKTRGKQKALVVTFHGPIRIAVDGEGRRYGFGGGTWYDG